MSIISTAKNQFKIILDSNNTASFSGRQFDATYVLDFNRIVMNQDDYDKPYLMTFYYKGAEAAHATTGLTGNEVFQLALDFGKGMNCVYNRNQFNIVGLLQLQTGVTTANASSMYALESDNGGVIVKNLRNINSCRLTVLQSSNNTVFNAADNAGINTAAKYVCCITLTEL